VAWCEQTFKESVKKKKKTSLFIAARPRMLMQLSTTRETSYICLPEIGEIFDLESWHWPEPIQLPIMHPSMAEWLSTNSIFPAHLSSQTLKKWITAALKSQLIKNCCSNGPQIMPSMLFFVEVVACRNNEGMGE